MYGANGSASESITLPFGTQPLWNFGPVLTGSAKLPTPDKPPGTTPSCSALNTPATNVVPSTTNSKSRLRAYGAAFAGGLVVLFLLLTFCFVVVRPHSSIARCCQITANCVPPLDQMPPLGRMDRILASIFNCKTPKPGEPWLLPREAITDLQPRNCCERVCVACSPDPEEGVEPPSGKGLVCTLTLGALIAMYASYALIKWYDTNITTNNVLVTYSPGLDFVVNPPLVRASTVGGMVGASGLALRFFVDGDPTNCSAPLSISSIDPSASVQQFTPSLFRSVFIAPGWYMQTGTACGGASRRLNQITLYCPTCRFTSLSSLTLTFHYTCQSLLMEAAAVSSYPVDSLSFARVTASATSGNGTDFELLKSVNWDLPVVLSAVIDLATDPPTAFPRLFNAGGNFSGYLLTTSTVVQSTQKLSSLSLPAPPVVVQVNIALQSFVDTTVLTLDEDVFTQLGSVVGFFPSVFANCAFVFLVMKVVLDRMYQAHKRSDKLLRGESTGDAKEAGGGDSFEAANPLTATAGGGSQGKQPPAREGGAPPTPQAGYGSPLEEQHREAPHSHHFFQHEDIPKTQDQVRAAAARAGCSEAEVLRAVAALQKDDLPESWGFSFSEHEGRVQFFSPEGIACPDPRDDFVHFIAAWVKYGGGGRKK